MALLFHDTITHVFHDLKLKLVVHFAKKILFKNIDPTVLSVKTLNVRKQIFRQKCRTT